MQYRKFGNSNWMVSVLGMGCMRLPIIDNDSSRIDEPEAIRLIHRAIEGGINYFDTAYPYHNGNSEVILGKALKDGLRQKVRIATKMPVWKIETYDDFDLCFNEQLEKLQTDYIDFYLLHGLRKTRWEKVRDLNVLEWVRRVKSDGRIGQIGFSFHDQYPVLKTIVDEYNGWDFCQIQYNFIDIDEQAGTAGLHYAAQKGLAVVIMEPLLGGRLANPPESINEIWKSYPIQKSPVEWSLQWLWNQPEVTVVLSGMSTFQQLEENLVYADKARVNSLNQQDLDLIQKVREKYIESTPIPCTKCEYCQPCPNDVKIPLIFEIFNKGAMIDNWGQARFRYGQLQPNELASNCVYCLQCEEVCPQNIPISQWLDTIEEVFVENKSYVDVDKPAQRR